MKTAKQVLDQHLSAANTGSAEKAILAAMEEYAAQKQPTPDEWIDIDCPPPEGQPLCFKTLETGNCLVIGFKMNGGFYFDSGAPIPATVTHWKPRYIRPLPTMPLVAPPVALPVEKPFLFSYNIGEMPKYRLVYAVNADTAMNKLKNLFPCIDNIVNCTL